MILLTTTIHISCWLLSGSIGWSTFAQPLADDAITLALIFLWLIQIATGGCLMVVVALSLAVSSAAAIIGATVVWLVKVMVLSGLFESRRVLMWDWWWRRCSGLCRW